MAKWPRPWARYDCSKTGRDKNNRLSQKLMESTNINNNSPVPSMILVTGGTGFIGSHTCVALVQAGHDLLILDNLCNSRADVIDRIKALSPRHSVLNFIEGDIRDAALLDNLFANHKISAVMHFAGLKAVVFSSSATVYGDPASVPIREDFPRSATNPYGRSKLIIEDILAALHQAEPDWRIARLRYFNPVGAHESGLIGEDPQGIPNNLMPFIAQVAVGKREYLNVWGNDYPTPDGTGKRDYIHVVDLAEGHVAALNHLNSLSPVQREMAGERGQSHSLITVNLGTGQGYSVLDMVKAFEQASGRTIPYKIAPRRPGDIAQCWADPGLAEKMLGWKAKRGLDKMCADSWRWQTRS